MSAPGKGSRWGSFLSQAVAGVESRLDNILAEADGDRSGPAHTTAPAPTITPKPASSISNSRASSTNRANDRLQARLAKAMAAKNAPSTGDNRSISSPRSSIDNISRSSVDNNRPSTDEITAEPSDPANTQLDAESVSGKDESAPEDAASSLPVEEEIEAAADSTVYADCSMTKQNGAETDAKAMEDEPHKDDDTSPSATKNIQNSTETHHGIEQLILQHQEEIREYVEQIDSLQAKLQYMSKSAAESAKTAMADTPSGSLEKKLLEKDERIALLMDEGQKLASGEQKYRTVIKKLRQQVVEKEKQNEELKAGKEKAALETEALRRQLSSNEEKETQQKESSKAAANLQKEIDSLKRDKANKEEIIRRLERDVKTKVDQATTTGADNLNKAITKERDKQKELENTNRSLQYEVEKLGEKALIEAVDWSEKLQRAMERGRAVEAELRVELQNMEVKLESMRVTAEEAISGTGGEAQIKLLRQIETLQSQYGSAKENWQGIEASLVAKANNFEKEKDEAQNRELEMRKKAREAAIRCRSLEEELHDTQPALATAQQELESCRNDLAALRISSKATETALEQAKAELDKEKRNNSRDLTAEAERRQWAEDVAGATTKVQSRPESPLLYMPRTFSSDLVGFGIPNRARKTPNPGSIPDSNADMTTSGRRPPFHVPMRSATMSTTSSTPFPSPLPPFEPIIETMPPLLQLPSGGDQESGADDTVPSSPRNLAQDMISVSTVAAGPSVQLVERMSAAIRRLEAEKVAAKEEMARVSAQRDEARGDMVGLMKELEDAKAASARIPDLEKEVADLDGRYQTTLELLGEKSELVEELRADVDDVKSMYRELVERTIK